MAQKVFLEEGGMVSVHTRIKDMCKIARNQQNISNQDIADRISEKFGLPDFSVNTVNNFFSERSKATTIYTTGYICSVLSISLDSVFGIDNCFNSEEEAEYAKAILDLKTELKIKESEVENLNRIIEDKEKLMKAVSEALNHYRHESELNIKKVQPWVFKSTLALLILSLLFIAFYLVYFDINNPAYGLFRNPEYTSAVINSAIIHLQI